MGAGITILLYLIIYLRGILNTDEVITVYTRVQVDSSISRIEILKAIFDPKFVTLVYPFSMARV